MGRDDRWFSRNPFEPDRRWFDWNFDVWHYTDRAGLEGIVASNVLWATEAAGLNDPSEVVRACDDLLATWEATRDELVPGAPVEDADRWLRQLTAETKTRRFYFVSACSEGDKLQHWISYAGGRGYALEFERNCEFRILAPESAPWLFRPLFAPFPWWQPVTYGDYRTGVSPRGGGLFYGRDGVMEAVLSGISAVDRGLIEDVPAYWDELERIYVTSVCTNKHNGYESEDEVRLVFAEPPVPEYIHRRPSRYSAEPTAYLKVAADCTDLGAYSVTKAPPLPLKRVRIGPRHGTDVTREIGEVRDLLHDTGYTDVPVVISDIPYRG